MSDNYYEHTCKYFPVLAVLDGEELIPIWELTRTEDPHDSDSFVLRRKGIEGKPYWREDNLNEYSYDIVNNKFKDIMEFDHKPEPKLSVGDLVAYEKRFSYQVLTLSTVEDIRFVLDSAMIKPLNWLLENCNAAGLSDLNVPEHTLIKLKTMKVEYKVKGCDRWLWDYAVKPIKQD